MSVGNRIAIMRVLMSQLRDAVGHEMIVRLDEAIEEHDSGAPSTALESILKKIAEATSSTDSGFSNRVTRLAERAASAFDPSERDIASVLARDVRRDLMCTHARKTESRNSCGPGEKSAQSESAELNDAGRIRYLGQ